MQEAKFSFNIHFSIQGYNAQFTLRDDESGTKLLKLVPQLLKNLEDMGATPAQRCEASKNGSPADEKNHNGSGVPECPKHHTSKLGKRGYFCPTMLDGGKWCEWEAPAPTERK